ncbi:cystatin-A1-like [Ranitomeya imitator]|uniref:cystatin-A1-like n=1 Tax=Ranitomeya imitator TaxID=111125 RepID=UPI0037E78AC0
MAGLPGGFGPEEPADAHVQAASDKVKAQFVKESGINAGKFKALSYISQVVAGTIYIVKVFVGDQCCHVKIFVPLPYTGKQPELMGFQSGKTKEESITVF